MTFIELINRVEKIRHNKEISAYSIIKSIKWFEEYHGTSQFKYSVEEEDFKKILEKETTTIELKMDNYWQSILMELHYHKGICLKHFDTVKIEHCHDEIIIEVQSIKHIEKEEKGNWIRIQLGQIYDVTELPF